jgi:hypothetical protein
VKVFISWSGERSKLLAVALREWLRPILQSVEVWMSEADIDAGDRWGQEVARELSSCNFGIICVTPENLGAPWLLFESGALAKSLEGSKVIPLLFELELRDISGPLAQFQAKKFDRNGLSEVANSINKTLPTPVADEVVKSLLDAMWPSIQHKIEAVPKREGDAKRVRSQADILEELVAGVRSFDSRLRDTEMAMSEQGMRSKRRKPRFYMPMVLETLSDIEGDDPLGLLVVAGVLREDLPWMSEILTEAYREIRRGNPRSVGRLIERVHRLTRMMMRGPLMEEMGSSKEQHMLVMELPMFLERYLHRIDIERSSAIERANSKKPSLPNEGDS